MDEVRNLRCDDHQGTNRRPRDCVLCKRIYHRNYYHATNRILKVRTSQKSGYVPTDKSIPRKKRKTIHMGCDQHGHYADTKNCKACKSVYMVRYFNNNRERMLLNAKEYHKRTYVKKPKKPKKKDTSKIEEPVVSNEN